MEPEVERIIARLGLEHLPQEGGFFRSSWVSVARTEAGRPAGSAIWFLLTPAEFSAWHRLRGEEVWHFYAGDPVEHVQLDPAGKELSLTNLGPEVLAGQQPQCVVRSGVWQGARLAPSGRRGWALLGCTLAPGWDERDFELGRREELLREFPKVADWVRALTR